MNRFLRLSGLLLAGAMSVATMALPAGATSKAGTTLGQSTSAPTFATELAHLQGKTVALANGATCTVRSTSCTVVSSGPSSLSLGRVLIIAPAGILHDHMPAMEQASFTIAITGVVTSIGEVLTWTLVVFLF
ncbi:MAG: hypothetical protein HKL86_01130 [Acidimicrobiaceae bacterium]|nr:hypothetical protein [Acidimicrobiaceae bacterium]